MTTNTSTLPPPRSEERTQRHLGLTVGLAVMGIFVTHVPITGVSIALANIGQATHASTSDLQWVSDGYVIPMAAAVLSAGLFGDRYRRRRLFLIGMALTVIGVAIAAAAGLFPGHQEHRGNANSAARRAGPDAVRASALPPVPAGP